MKFLGALRPVRILLTVCVCAFLVFSYAFPAYSATSSPTKGEDKLTTIERKSQEEVMTAPKSLEETTKKAQGGINAIQGGADAEKMYTPDDSQSTTSVEEKIGDALQNIKGTLTGDN
ncbi:low temperature-induced protein [Desertifilum sp. FACHB-1129]|uniref:Low temperature-induced protein n=2 Tax=Desertifilaceae TaxID=1969992 RepID=A0A1E5QQ66_9CYAN|nr:hypothetical protein [Desertifilum tharense]MBD2314562.1 low temperature-induced protein [Desertifilum sp. FACHB-1129]MBD2321761.1 low temperature-induced protein [Desertifilum sp. FACHB-866]MBD2331888.1 low temperature-induced protein [Desertifilum sp. FACHB-868]MCD8486212.1 low temperature-induced protein [Desertifilum sp.]OEJ76754.1 hypothetical protein BH720_03050 [Desertifilum tharense IPPAS B-1220]